METNTTIYFDYNATTPIEPAVTESMLPYFNNFYFNSSSAYKQSSICKEAIEESRRIISGFLGTKETTEIIFTGSATESNNAAILGALKANPRRNHIITTAVEHPSVLELCKDLERYNYEVTYLSTNERGEVDLKELINSIRPNTAIVSIMHVNNETGVVFPIDKLSKIVKMTDPKIIFHTDATQGIGKIAIDLENNWEYVDMLTFSGHKIYAPKGVGALYCRKGTSWRPFIIGGHQEKGRRAGTENVPYIVALGTAIRLAHQKMMTTQEFESYRDELEEFVQENIPAVRINGIGAERVKTTTNISFEGIEGESILYSLNEHGICASTGSACSSGSLAASHVLQSMNIPFTYAHGSLRISFGRFNMRTDLDTLMDVLPKIVKRLRDISPFWDNKTNQGKEIL
jgi:cysteine desulfurase